jgi:hypothetical protein
MSDHLLPLFILIPVFVLFAASAAAEEWTSTVAEFPYTMADGTPGPDRNGKLAVGKDGQPVLYKTTLLLPAGVKVIRGLLIGGQTWTSNAPVRTALAEEGLGLLYYGNPDGLFYYVTNGSGPRLERDLKALAEKSGHPEVAFAPWMTIGYSTSGITCRNIAYWNPDRVIGVMHMMSGNFQAHIQDLRASLAGVPFLVGNGECEQYGPDGGELGAGHRGIYSLEKTDKKMNNQTQWVMVRMQLLERRRRNENNLMGLVVQHTLGNSKDHTQHAPALYPLLAQFIHSAAAARIPKGDPDGKTPVKCLPLTAKDGWLCDADIKNPKFAPAPYADYKGDRTLAFWYPDKAMAEAVAAYHAQPWAFPDPTAGLPPEQRFRVVEPGLRDIIDLPEPPSLAWAGGDGTWSDGGGWLKAGAPVPWSPDCQAYFQGKGGTVALAGPLTANGLQLGAGYTLALNKHRLSCTWHAVLQPNSTLAVTLAPGDGKGDGALRLQVVGNLDLAGTLVITAAGDLPDGGYQIVRYGGKLTGGFAKVVPPAGYTATAKGGVVTLKKGG